MEVNVTSPVAVVAELEQGGDNVLRLVSRIMAAVVLVAIIGLCIALPILKKELGPKSIPRPMRAHKFRQLLYNVCCFGYCCPGVPKKLGFNALESLTLRITLIGAANIASALDFYFEVWTEPAEGHPKMSRIHQEAVGNISLHQETIELDWFGDEEEVVIQCVQYCGSQVSKDVAVGQVRISRDKIERYAQESASNPGDVSRGTRSYPMEKLSAMGARQRQLRFSGPSPQLLPKILTKIQEDSGFEVPDAELHARLKEENEALRKVIEEKVGSHVAQSMKSVIEKPLPEVLFTVALRLEIVSPQTISAESFRSPSFEIQQTTPLTA